MQAVTMNGNLIWINGAGYGYKTSGRYEFFPIPEQDVSALFKKNEAEDEWDFIGSLNDITLIFDISELPVSEHIGKLMAVNPALAKPATVRRRFMGENYDVNCLVTQSVAELFQQGDIQIDDYVVVSFIEETPNETERNVAIVTDKVFESWS